MGIFFSYTNLAITRLRRGGTVTPITPVQPPASSGIYKNFYNSIYK